MTLNLDDFPSETITPQEWFSQHIGVVFCVEADDFPRNGQLVEVFDDVTINPAMLGMQASEYVAPSGSWRLHLQFAAYPNSASLPPTFLVTVDSQLPLPFICSRIRVSQLFRSRANSLP